MLFGVLKDIEYALLSIQTTGTEVLKRRIDESIAKAPTSMLRAIQTIEADLTDLWSHTVSRVAAEIHKRDAAAS